MNRGDKVRDKKTGKVYDFGYIGSTGKVVCYEEGECNMQDAIAIPLEDLELSRETEPVHSAVRMTREQIVDGIAKSAELCDQITAEIAKHEEQVARTNASIDSLKKFLTRERKQLQEYVDRLATGAYKK